MNKNLSQKIYKKSKLNLKIKLKKLLIYIFKLN